MPPNSVVVEPNGTFGAGGINIPQLEAFSIVATYAEAADSIPLWGTAPAARDRALREFWPQEDTFAGTLYSTVARYSAFEWNLKGGPRTVTRVHDLLHGAEHGQGWDALITKTLIDLYTQDNGAFIEIVRYGRTPSSPVAEINHLDSARCVRSGRWDFPITYYDLDGKGHRMPAHNVIDLTDFPSPSESHRGMQYCALTRILRTAQVMREIALFMREKVSGRFDKGIHLVSGVSTKMIEDAVQKHHANADAQGQMHYILPVVMGTLDPNAKVDHAFLELASLPDGFDQEVAMRWYITKMALAFGAEYSDYAPLPGQGIGSGSQAQVGHLKSRGKGPAKFMSVLEHAFNFHGVMPTNVTFSFGEVDTAAGYDRMLLRKERALYLQILIDAGAITTEVARQMLVDWGDMDISYLEMMREHNATEDISVPGGERVPDLPTDVTPGEPGPKAPAGSTSAPNNNANTTKPATATKRPAQATASAGSAGR